MFTNNNNLLRSLRLHGWQSVFCFSVFHFVMLIARKQKYQSANVWPWPDPLLPLGQEFLHCCLVKSTKMRKYIGEQDCNIDLRCGISVIISLKRQGNYTRYVF